MDYPQDFTCRKDIVHKSVCACSPGYTGGLCATVNNQSCFVNITDPPLYAGCSYPDTDYYLYSLGGFAPCYWYDFTKTYTFQILIQCMMQVPNVLGNLGYQYRNVIEAPQQSTLGSVAP